MLLTEI